MNNSEKLYNSLKRLDPSFTRTYNEFMSDMQDENNRFRLHSNLSKLDNSFTRTYDEFSMDIGFGNKEKRQSLDAYTRPQTESTTQTFSNQSFNQSSNPTTYGSTNQPQTESTIEPSTGLTVQSDVDPYAYLEQQITAYQPPENDTTDYSKVKLPPLLKEYYDKYKKGLTNPLKAKTPSQFLQSLSPAISPVFLAPILAENTKLEHKLQSFAANTELGKKYAEAYNAWLDKISPQIDPLIKEGKKIRNLRANDIAEQQKQDINFASRSETTDYSLYVRDPDISLANKSLKLLKDAQNRIDAYKNGKGFQKGITPSKEFAIALVTFSEFINDRNVKKAIDKYEKDPESLTEAEKLAVNAKYVSDQILAGVDPGIWFNVGQVVKESLPIARDIAFSGGAARAGSRALIRNAPKIIQKITPKLAETTGKFVASSGELLAKKAPQLAKLGDKWGGKAARATIDLIIRPTVQTILSPSSHAMAYEEQQGFAADRDENGKIIFEGREGVLPSYVSPYIENQSEVMGEILLSPLLKKHPFFRNVIKAGKGNALAKKLRNRIGIQDLLSEFVEEKYPDLVDIFRGRQTLGDFFDPRQNAETGLSVGAMQGPFKGLEAAGYGVGKARDIQNAWRIAQEWKESSKNVGEAFNNEQTELTARLNQRINQSGLNDLDLNKGLENICEDEELTYKQKKAVLEYTAAYSAYSGLKKAYKEEIQETKQKAIQKVRENLNPNMNAVVSAVVNGKERQIVGGNIVRKEDGSIDREQSDSQIYYLDEDNKRQVTSLEFVESVVEEMPAEEAVKKAVKLLTQPVVDRQKNEKVRPYEAGEAVRFKTPDGGSSFGSIQDRDENGYYRVQVPGFDPITVEPRMIINDDHLRGVENGSTVRYKDEEGIERQGTVEDAYNLRSSGKMIIDGNEVRLEDVAGLAGGKDAADSTETETEEPPVPYKEQIPKNEEGLPLFEQAAPEVTLGALREDYDGNEEYVRQAVEAVIAKKQEQLKEVSTPQFTGDAQEDSHHYQQAKVQAQEIQRELDYWKGVLDLADQTTESIPSTEGSGKEANSLDSTVETKVNADEIQPIGRGFFGNIYDQFKGKVKEAFNFLASRKEGDLIGVFHRDELGDIDLIWGSVEDKTGLAHIEDKHINRQNDFANINEAADIIGDVVNNGTVTKDTNDKAIIEKDGYRVIVKKTIRDNAGNIIHLKNWIVTAYDRARGAKEKKASANTLTTPIGNKGSRAVTPDADTGKRNTSPVFDNKGSENNSETQKVRDQIIAKMRPVFPERFSADYHPETGWMEIRGADKDGYSIRIKESKYDPGKYEVMISERIMGRDNIPALQNFFNETLTLDQLNDIPAIVANEKAESSEQRAMAQSQWKEAMAKIDSEYPSEKSTQNNTATTNPAFASGQEGSKNNSPAKKNKNGRKAASKKKTIHAKRRESLGMSREELDLRGRILWDISAGQAGFYVNDKVSKEGKVLLHGLKSELGLRKDDLKPYKYLTTFAAPKYYIEEYAERFAEEGFEDDLETRNVILDVLQSFPDPAAAMQELEYRYGQEQPFSEEEIQEDIQLNNAEEEIEKKSIADEENYPEEDMFNQEIVSLEEEARKAGATEDEIWLAQSRRNRLENLIQKYKDERGRAIAEDGGDAVSMDDRSAHGILEEKSISIAEDRERSIRREREEGRSSATEGSIPNTESERGSILQNTGTDRRGDRFEEDTQTNGAIDSSGKYSNEGAGDRAGEDRSRVGLTPLQQKYVEEQTAAYDRKMETAKRALETAAGEKEKQAAEERARDEYNRLLNERPAAIEKIVQQAKTQREINFPNETQAPNEAATAGKTVPPEKSAAERLAEAGGDLLAFAKAEAEKAEIRSEEAKTDTHPTEAQKEAGNYKKGHVTVQGFAISIEQPKGSVRSGTDEKGKRWSQKMNHTYGYFRGTQSRDGDQIDVFLGDNTASKKAFVVDQMNPNTGLFDEHKVLLGFNSIEEARKAYLSNYEEGWKGLGKITETTIEDFRKWAETEGRRIKPFAEYQSNQKATPAVPKVSPKADERYSLMSPTDKEPANYRVDKTGDGNVTVRNYKTFTEKTLSLDEFNDYKQRADDFNNPIRLQSVSEEEDAELEAANTQFNKELQQQIDGRLPKGHVYKLGMPMKILIATGFPNLSIELNAGILLRKATVYGHNFDLSEIKDLPKAIQNPLAIFAYGDKTKAQNVIVEIESKNGKKFLVGISLNPNIKGKSIEVNSIRNVFPKDTHEWVNWINQGKGLYFNKEKILSFLDQQRINPADVAFGFPEKQAQQGNSKLSESDLDSAIKIIENFENPKFQTVDSNKSAFTPISKEELDALIDRLKQTGVAEEVIADPAEYDRAYSEATEYLKYKDGTSYGFATKDGKVYLDPSKMNANTPIHEFGHLWNDLIKQNHRGLWEKGVELAKQSAEWEKVKNDPNYANLKTDDQIADEVLGRLYGNRGEAIFQEQGIGEKLRAWVKQVWEWIGNAAGIRNLTAEQIQNLTLQQFVDGAVVDLLSGKRIALESKAKETAADPSKYDFDVSGISEANAQEMQRIKTEAQANGTFMKAPNGKPTKLNERQWLQVRTQAFKNWFGDWEAAAKLQMIEDLAAIGINPNSYTRKELEQFYNDTPNGKNKLDNREVSFSHSVFGKMLRFGTEGNFAKIVPQLKDIFENSVPIYSEQEETKDGHKQHPNFVGYHNYLGKVKIDGKEYYVRFTVQEHRETIQNKGKRNPNELHNAFVSDVAVYNKSAASEITDPRTTGRVTETAAFIDTKLQKFFQSAKFSRENSSKAVDENGEPLVVYHGTNPTAFHSKSGEYFFSENRDYAEGKNGDSIISGFVNVRNPYKAALPIHPFIDPSAERKQLDDAKKNGYDGVILNPDAAHELEKDIIFVVFNPGQIQSAADNNGNFDNKSDDIRFQFAGEKGAAALDILEEAHTRLDNLSAAKEMESSGKDAKAIKYATGWEKGADGKWRYEIPDIALKNIVYDEAKRMGRENLNRMVFKLGEIVDADDLFKA
ncbi:MAG: hypothetical protein FWF52_03080, partial [Candidatus Azobacteroides sp.]|nr:hypothetical protein [Candidatus Azobacteroides sp.]